MHIVVFEVEPDPLEFAEYEMHGHQDFPSTAPQIPNFKFVNTRPISQRKTYLTPFMCSPSQHLRLSSPQRTPAGTESQLTHSE